MLVFHLNLAKLIGKDGIILNDRLVFLVKALDITGIVPDRLFDISGREGY
jgi:hypothetical protein